MKKLLSILIATFFLSNIVTYAQKENNPFTEIALTQAKRKDPISKGDTPISRSIIQTANAYLYNNLKSATPFPKCYLHKEKWTFDS